MPTTTDYVAPERRFTDAQLARLLEISSAVQCECPNHLSKLVDELVEFERYSQGCLVQNTADSEIHALLYRRTAEARAIMEEALVELIRFEGIEL